MSASAAVTVLAALATERVDACVGGGWAIDALLGSQTRPHSDLDLWAPAPQLSALFTALATCGVDRMYPWPGDRPWNFVLHDGGSLRVDLHLYESLGDGRLQYGSVTAPFGFVPDDLAGAGMIGAVGVVCETPAFVLRCRSGWEPRPVDRQDVALLCERFGLAAPERYG
jgi:lincosamide nucleotidyltransferase A/C/D/E